MSDNHASAIVILLALILAVLLFGSGIVLGGLGLLLAAAATIAVVWLSAILVGRVIKSFRDELKIEKEAGTFYSGALGYIGLLGNFIMAGAVYLTKDDHETFKNALANFPLFWLPVALLLLSIPLARVEKAITTRNRKSRSTNTPKANP